VTRSLWVWLHRWSGLAIAGFLIVVGVTGSLLAFYSELNHLLAPELYPNASAGAALDPATLAHRAEVLVPRARTNTVYLGYEAPVAEIHMEAKSGAPDLDFSTIYLNLHTGEELGRLFWGAVPTTRAGVMPFVYQLHMTLIAGEVGAWILGIAALAWTLDSFVGFYLTLPGPSERTKKSFLSRWKPAWLIKFSGSLYRVNFDLHRAGGLWLWVMLLIFAWSSVYMNLNGFYSRAMSLLFDYQQPFYFRHVEASPQIGVPMTWAVAQARGRELMEEQARTHGFVVDRELALYILRDKGAWEYRVRSSRDIGDKYGQTSVWFDAVSGELRNVTLPTGLRAGDTITTWFYELHKANLFGLPYRIFICVLGVAITILSVTGVYIWLKKRRARLAHARHSAVRPASAERFFRVMRMRLRS
jgi:uncharacterized iron-regulated membrane protein